MKEQIISKIYAKSLMMLAQEEKLSVADEMTKLQETINASNDLENILFLDVFTVEEKVNVFSELSKKLNLNKVLNNFVTFLIQEKRTNLIPLIYKDVIVLEDNEKGFMRGTVSGADDKISDDQIKLIKDYLKKKLNKEIVLDYQASDRVTAGYRVTVEDLQLDATIDNQLELLKSSIIGE